MVLGKTLYKESQCWFNVEEVRRDVLRNVMRQAAGWRALG